MIIPYGMKATFLDVSRDLFANILDMNVQKV